jgi:hypothetical protein
MKQPSFYWTVSTVLIAIFVAAAVMLFVGCTVNRYGIINVPEQPNILTWEDNYDPGFYQPVTTHGFFSEDLRPLSIDLTDTLNCQHPAVMSTEMYCPTSQCNTCTCMDCGKKWKC